MWFEDPHRRLQEPFGIPRNDGVTANPFSGRGADGILEVGKPESQSAAKNRPIHGRDAWNQEKVVENPPRKTRVVPARDEREDGGDPVRGEEHLDLIPLGRRP